MGIYLQLEYQAKTNQQECCGVVTSAGSKISNVEFIPEFRQSWRQYPAQSKTSVPNQEFLLKKRLREKKNKTELSVIDEWRLVTDCSKRAAILEMFLNDLSET